MKNKFIVQKNYVSKIKVSELSGHIYISQKKVQRKGPLACNFINNCF